MNSNFKKPYYYPTELSHKGQKHSFRLSIRAYYSFRALIVWIVLCALLIGGAVYLFPSDNVETLYYQTFAHPAPTNIDECIVVVQKSINRVKEDGIGIFKPVFYLDANDVENEKDTSVYNEINVDTNKDGTPDVNVDTNGDGIPNLYLDANKDNKADLDVRVIILFSCAFGGVIALLILLIALVVLFVRLCRVKSVVYEFYDNAIVTRWGVFFKRYRESKFIGVYEIFCSPGRSLLSGEPKVKRDGSVKEAKYGNVFAKTPGGLYTWNLKFYGVKNCAMLYNYLETRKIYEHMNYTTKTLM